MGVFEKEILKPIFENYFMTLVLLIFFLIKRANFFMQ